MIKGKFNTIVDSAWGSSAKGAASSRLVEIHGVKNASAANYPNAGHTCIVGDVKFVSKALPTSAILKKTKGLDLTLWLGPNSGFQMGQFTKEMEESGYADNPIGKVLVHERAMIVEQRHINAESPVGVQSTEHVSSTMSGAGAALTEKAMRKKEVVLAGQLYKELSLSPMDFVRSIRGRLGSGEAFMHEVSQGWALSINHGTHYPHCTSRDCTPQQAYADFGITPHFIGDVYLNVRSFAIRVGNNFRDGKQTGYSGDCMPDQRETSWEEIGKNAEMPQSEINVLAEKERTTVTKKIRRCFTPSSQLLRDSAEFCGATKLILNFPQYIHWSSHKLRGGREQIKDLHPKVRAYIDRMEADVNLPVVMIGTGAEHHDYIYLE